MTVRIKFRKYGILKFIGHLDLMRFFQKAIRRAGFDVIYSKGFSPHQIMAFASPLGVGLTSDAEYLDVELAGCEEPEAMLERLNQVMTEGIAATGFQVLPELLPNQKKETAMSLVAAADYLISLKDGYEPGMKKQDLETKFREFLAQEEIRILKKSKKSEKETDIRPMIYESDFLDEDAFPDSCAQRYENGIRIFLQVSAGSAANLKPELVMEAFSEFAGIAWNEFAWQIHRLELYRDVALTGMSQLKVREAAAENRLPPRSLVPLIAG